MTIRIKGLVKWFNEDKGLASSLLLMVVKTSLFIFLRLTATTLRPYLKDRKLNSPFTVVTKVLLLQT